MTDNPVRDLLKQLHTTLEGASKFSDEDRKLLEHLAADIRTVLAKPGTPAAGSHQTLIDRLQAAVTRFEVSHPDLTATMEQVSKKLADMGI